MNTRPLVSIVIPIKNRSWCLPTLLESIEHQDFPREQVEVIFIDNMSNDETYELLNRWRSDIGDFRKITVDRIGGPLPKVRNRGIELSSGEYILFLDSDITFPKYAVSRLLEHTHNEEIDVFHAPCIPTNMNLTYKIMSLHNFRSLEKGETVRVRPSRAEFGFTLFRRSFFNELGLFNEDSSLDGKRGNWADMELMHRADKLHHEAIIDYSIRISHLKEITPRSFLSVYLAPSHVRWFLDSIKRGSLFQLGRFLYYLALPLTLALGIYPGNLWGISSFGRFIGAIVFSSLGLIWNLKSRPDQFPLVVIRALANMLGGILLAYNSAFFYVKEKIARCVRLYFFLPF